MTNDQPKHCETCGWQLPADTPNDRFCSSQCAGIPAKPAFDLGDGYVRYELSAEETNFARILHIPIAGAPCFIATRKY